MQTTIEPTLTKATLAQPTPCNLCGVDDATLLYAAGVAQINPIVRCNRCNLMYASPRAKAPDHVEIEAWEDDPSFDMAQRRPQRYEKERLQVRDYASTRRLLAELYPQRGRLLELGSSMGFLLQSFHKDGWDVLGVDPNRYACRHAREKLGLPAIASTLEEADIPDASFDVVVMLHVIEHVPDPLATLREINRVLKPGGHLILETPRYDTWLFRLLGRRERSLSCDGHIYFFTTDTLQKTYERAGFSLVQLDIVGRSLTLDRLAYNVGVMSKSKTVQRLLGTTSRRLGLQHLKLSLNFGDMQRVCVRKEC
jgi:2-polyprenyl-3-methyl-5-hydroxy-6-metoxy-1,4-benzoquinol methylase